MSGILGRLTPRAIRLAFRFERFFHLFIGYYLDKKLEEYRRRRLITDYKVRAGRKGRYHYLFEVDLLLNTNEEVNHRE